MILSNHQLVFYGTFGEAYIPNAWNVAGTSGSFGAGDRRECLAHGMSGHFGSHVNASHHPQDERQGHLGRRGIPDVRTTHLHVQARVGEGCKPHLPRLSE